MRVKKAKVNSDWGRERNKIQQWFLEKVCFDLSPGQWGEIRDFGAQRTACTNTRSLTHCLFSLRVWDDVMMDGQCLLIYKFCLTEFAFD